MPQIQGLDEDVKCFETLEMRLDAGEVSVSPSVDSRVEVVVDHARIVLSARHARAFASMLLAVADRVEKPNGFHDARVPLETVG